MYLHPYPFHFSGICIRRCYFFAVQAPCAFWHGSPLKTGALETGSPSGFAGFSTITTFTGGNSLKKENNATENQLPQKKKFRVPYQNIILGVAAFAYFFTLQTNQVLARDIWSKADTILKNVYGKILGISTIAAIVTASVALSLMNFSKSGRTVDESRAWLHYHIMGNTEQTRLHPRLCHTLLL